MSDSEKLVCGESRYVVGIADCSLRSLRKDQWCVLLPGNKAGSLKANCFIKEMLRLEVRLLYQTSKQGTQSIETYHIHTVENKKFSRAATSFNELFVPVNFR